MNVSKAVNQFEFYIATASVAAAPDAIQKEKKKVHKTRRYSPNGRISWHHRPLLTHTHTVFFNSKRKNKKCNTHRRMEWSFTLFPKILREKKKDQSEYCRITCAGDTLNCVLGPRFTHSFSVCLLFENSNRHIEIQTKMWFVHSIILSVWTLCALFCAFNRVGVDLRTYGQVHKILMLLVLMVSR